MHEALSSIQIARTKGEGKRGGEEEEEGEAGDKEGRKGRGRGGKGGVRDHSHQVEVSVNPDGGPVPMPLEP